MAVEDGGWVRVWRKLHESLIWTEYGPPTLKVFIACLILADWKSMKWFDGKEEIVLAPGSFVTSLKTFASFTRLTVQQIRDAWSHLEAPLGMIARRTRPGTGLCTAISVLNYGTYQVIVQPIQHGPPHSERRTRHTTVHLIEVSGLKPKTYQVIVQPIQHGHPHSENTLALTLALPVRKYYF